MNDIGNVTRQNLLSVENTDIVFHVDHHIGDYREQLVMNKARQLLTMGKLSVRKIAEELGFSGQFYFSKYFKQRQGITPSAYKSHYISNIPLSRGIVTTEPATD